MSSAIRLGTRGSALALAQAKLVADALGGAEIVAVRGEPPTAGGGDKARFVRGVEDALLAEEVDVGVHSAKDLPAELPDQLRLAGVPAREAPADAFVGDAPALDEVRAGARIGTSSLRRRAQLLAVRPDLEVTELRGNVDTRLGRLADGDFDGIVLATAGLRRLGREDEIAFRFDARAMTPAAGQGALALEARREDEPAAAAAARISDATALVEVTAERAAVGELAATCRTPVGVRAELSDGRLRADAFVGLPDGSEWVRDTVEGDPEDPVALGRALAERLVAAG
ncbi:MAG: hydroxymethylbilane synthase, partial [Solirubrobacterales bacterium]